MSASLGRQDRGGAGVYPPIPFRAGQNGAKSNTFSGQKKDTGTGHGVGEKFWLGVARGVGSPGWQLFGVGNSTTPLLAG